MDISITRIPNVKKKLCYWRKGCQHKEKLGMGWEHEGRGREGERIRDMRREEKGVGKK